MSERDATTRIERVREMLRAVAKRYGVEIAERLVREEIPPQEVKLSALNQTQLKSLEEKLIEDEWVKES